MNFQELKGNAIGGKVKVWSVKVVEKDGAGVIEVTHGYEGGKMQVLQKTISEG